MIKHYTLTLNGNPQLLSTALATTLTPQARRIGMLWLQPNGANGNPVYVGNAALTTSDYGVRLEAGAAGVPPAPFLMGEGESGMLDLENIYVLGTNTQLLHILVDHW